MVKKLFICFMAVAIFSLTSCADMFVHNLENEVTTGTWSGELKKFDNNLGQFQIIGNITISFNGDRAKVTKIVNGTTSTYNMFYTKEIISKDEIKKLQGHVTQLSYTDMFVLTENKLDKRPVFAELENNNIPVEDVIGKNGLYGSRLNYNFLGIAFLEITTASGEHSQLYR